MLKPKLAYGAVLKAKHAIWEKHEWFSQYSLRHFFATWMISKGMSEAKVDFIQGRAPRTILRFYASITCISMISVPKSSSIMNISG